MHELALCAKMISCRMAVTDKGGLKMLSFILSIVYGAIAGWIASKIMNTQGGTLRNIITGIVGGMIGSFLFRLVGVYASGFFANLIVSVIGACIFIFVGKKLFGRS